jgi:hypothetical protein
LIFLSFQIFFVCILLLAQADQDDQIALLAHFAIETHEEVIVDDMLLVVTHLTVLLAPLIVNHMLVSQDLSVAPLQDLQNVDSIQDR